MALTRVDSSSPAFIQPHEGFVVSIQLDPSIRWIKVGSKLNILKAGVYEVTNIVGFTHTLKLLEAEIEPEEVVPSSIIYPIKENSNGVDLEGYLDKTTYDPTGVEGDAFDYGNFHNTPDINNSKIKFTLGEFVAVEFDLNQPNDETFDLSALIINVEDNLTSTSTSNALSANQGRVLKDLINNLQSVVNSGISLQGGYDAGTETEFPGGGNALKGNAWYITNSGSIRGVDFEPGDMLIANTDSSSTTDINDWIAIQTNIGQATESTPGHAKIATSAIALAGTNDTDIMTAKKVKEVVENISQMLETSTSIDIVDNEIRTKAVTGDVSIPANGVTSTITNGAVTYAKIQNVSSKSLLGRHASSNGSVQEIKLADNLEFDGSDLAVVWGSEQW